MNRSWRVVIALVLAGIAGGCGTAQGPAPENKTGASVRERLAGGQTAHVIVPLREPEAPVTDLETRRQQIEARQKSVLDRLTSADFHLTDRWDHINALAGEVTASG